MFTFTGLYNTQGMLFCLIILGCILKKIGIITDAGEHCLTDITLQVTLPAMILCSFQIEFNMTILMQFLSVILVSCGIQAFGWVLNLFLYRKIPDRRAKVLKFCTLGNNCGLLGIPMAEGIFGSIAVSLASIYLIPLRVVMWTIGIGYFTEAPDAKTLIKKCCTQPAIVATVVGLIMMIFQLQFPTFLSMSVQKMNGCFTGLAMLVVGCIVARMDLKSLAEPAVLGYDALRLLIMPAVVLAACAALHIDSLTTQMAVIMTGMPAAANTALLAEKFGGDEVYAGQCVVSSTLLSMVTIPILCFGMHAIGML